MINSIRLEQFKNFRDATLNLGPLTVIVGTNASGKSNLRDAFRFVHGISRDYTLADIVGEKFVEGSLQWKGVRGGSREIATSGTTSFCLETDLTWVTERQKLIREKYLHRIRIVVNQGSRPLRVMNESLYRDDNLVYDSHPPNDRPLQEGPQ